MSKTAKDTLLKDAIADAKAVRETALANAKLAIQEAFTPKLQSMISSKLRNEAEEEDVDETAEGSFKEPGEGVPTGLDSTTKELDPTIERERDEDDVDEATDVTADQGQDPEKEKAGKVPGQSPYAGGGVEQYEGKKLDEAEPYAGEETPEEEEAEEETDEDSITKEGEEIYTDGEGQDDEMPGADEEDEQSDDMKELEGIIKELEDDADIEDEEPELDAEEELVPSTPEWEQIPPEEESVPPEDDDVDEAKDVTADQGQDPEKEKGSGIAPNAGSGSDTAKEPGSEYVEFDLEKLVKEIESEMKPEEEEEEEGEDVDINKLDALKQENVSLTKNLKEHRKVIEYLRSKLQEINLLNAKLLFSNKLFRGNNLTEAQKLRIIESIDRANTVREVKLVYATLAETFKKKVGLIESKKSVVKSNASKAGGTTKPSKTVLAEGSTLAERFKRLSGGKKISRIL